VLVQAPNGYLMAKASIGQREVPMKRSIAMLIMVLVIGLLGCTRLPEGITPVKDFNLSRYLGSWHEVARLDHRFERGPIPKEQGMTRMFLSLGKTHGVMAKGLMGMAEGVQPISYKIGVFREFLRKDRFLLFHILMDKL